MAKHAENPDNYFEVSKNYWKKREQLEKGFFFGSPQNLDEIIYVASDQLYKGNWKECQKLVL